MCVYINIYNKRRSSGDHHSVSLFLFLSESCQNPAAFFFILYLTRSSFTHERCARSKARGLYTLSLWRQTLCTAADVDELGSRPRLNCDTAQFCLPFSLSGGRKGEKEDGGEKINTIFRGFFFPPLTLPHSGGKKTLEALESVRALTGRAREQTEACELLSTELKAGFANAENTVPSGVVSSH